MIRALHYKIRCSNASWNIHSMGCEAAAKQYPNHDGRPPQHPEPGQSPAPSPLRPHPSDWCSSPKELRGSRSCFPVSILIRQLALSLQSFQSELLKHKPNYTPQPLLSLQWLPIPFRITSKSVPESLQDLCHAYLLIPEQPHQTFILTLNLLPPSYFVFHFPRWLFFEISA